MSSTVPVAISPAAPDHTLTVHDPIVCVASVCGFGGYRSSQLCTFGEARNREIACARETSGFGVIAVVPVVVVVTPVVVPAAAAGASTSATATMANALSGGTTRACSRGS